jgi:hypothetical protein
MSNDPNYKTLTVKTIEPSRPLHVAIAETMASLSRLPESGKNQQQGYKFVTESDIFDAVRGELGKRGVTIVQEHGEIISIEDNPTKSGGLMRTVNVLFRFHAVHGPSGDNDSYAFVGVGADTGDKWYTKASTSAAKFFIRRMFLISAGGAEDPDSQSHERAQVSKRETGPPVITDGQRRALFAAARGKGLNEEAVRGLVAEHRGGNQSTQGMPVAVFDAIMAQLAKFDAIPAPPATSPEPPAPPERSLEEWANEHWDAVMRHATDLGMTGPGATAMLAVAGFKRPTDLVKEGDLASTVLVDEAVRVLTNELARRGGAA